MSHTEAPSRTPEARLSLAFPLTNPGQWFRAAAFLVLGLLAAPGLGAQALESEDAVVSSGPDRASPYRGNVRAAVAVRRDGPIQVDGRLDDEAWGAATPISGFTQKEPDEGAPAAEPTEVRVLFDDRAIYIGARMLDSQPGLISRRLARRDQDANTDFFEVSLDPNLDRRTGYQFSVSAANVQGDRYLYDDNRDDRAWNAVWESAVHHDEDGWSVEIRIPLSQVRYDPSDGPQTWGVNFSRRRTLTNERSFFAPEPRNNTGVVSLFGLLEGIQATTGSRRFEARPYALTGLRSAPATPGDPFFSGREAKVEMGVDLRYGLGSAFTLDATVNPDFGQVEADPATINLSAFEVFLDERRPFFVEDARILDFSLSGMQNKLFYSRRVGRAPQGGAPRGATFVNAADAATILGAAKFTGRTTGGLSVGALAAVTRGEEGEAFFGEDGSTRRFLAEPRTQYGVLRLQQDYRQGQSVFGGIVTGLNRELPSDGSFDWLPSAAASAGIDFEHSWADRNWALHGFFAGSHVMGDSLAITRIQRASNHFFQRPDASRLEVDSTSTSMTGAEWRLQLDRRNGRHWNGSIWAAQVTSGFEINDIGFSRSAERLDGGARISYRELTPGSFYRNYNVSVFTFHNFGHEALDRPGSLESWRDAHFSGSVNSHANITLANWWNVNADLRWSPELMSRTATRGGPLVVDPSTLGMGLRLRTDDRRMVTIRPSVNVSRGQLGGNAEFRTSVAFGVRPSPRLEVEVEPSWSRNQDAAQYVATTSVLPFAPTFGSRYLFAKLEQRSISMETRLNVTFTPTLTLQLFAQPLLSSGDFTTYRQLLEPKSYAFEDFRAGAFGVMADGAVSCSGGKICQDPGTGRQHVDFDGDGRADYSFSDRDFNVRSLRGNAVLRWEYRPGSTVFLVWQQRRSEEAALGMLDFRRDLRALATAPTDNVFMLKVNYWLGL